MYIIYITRPETEIVSFQSESHTRAKFISKTNHRIARLDFICDF